uniref:U2A'/phosphoprotein 32 family A C-terminal domain-containing protein n=1 Tax=Ciona savignyi TaxID=51511 RepID=H2YH23_CIOSA
MRITDKALAQPEAFANVQTIVLNKCSLSWEQVLTCTTMWPQVAELHLEANNLTHLSPPNGKLAHVRELYLSGNPFNSWQEVRHLAKLPKLSFLLLNECGLSDLSVEFGDFENLEKLYLARNAYASVNDVNPLNNLPKLHELIFRKNPAYNHDRYETVHDMIIAKIKRLKRLDRLEVGQQDRFTAEMDYLRNFGLEWRESGGHQDPQPK